MWMPLTPGYIDRMKLVDIKAYKPSFGTFETFHELARSIQRPYDCWNRGVHWISPENAEAHGDYLRVLGEAGFD